MQEFGKVVGLLRPFKHANKKPSLTEKNKKTSPIGIHQRTEDGPPHKAVDEQQSSTIDRENEDADALRPLQEETSSSTRQQNPSQAHQNEDENDESLRAYVVRLQRQLQLAREQNQRQAEEIALERKKLDEERQRLEEERQAMYEKMSDLLKAISDRLD